MKPENTEQEKWLDVVGYEGIYMVSSIGRIWSLNTRRGHNPGLRIVRFGNRGYMMAWLCNRDEKNVNVSKLVAEAFLGPRPKGMYINHINGNKTDNRVENLEYCTPSQNNIHSYAHGLQPRRPGEKHPLSKLKEDHVREILLMIKEGWKDSEIAGFFRVTIGNIFLIRKGQRWLHIERETV